MRSWIWQAIWRKGILKSKGKGSSWTLVFINFPFCSFSENADVRKNLKRPRNQKGCEAVDLASDTEKRYSQNKRER